MWERCDSDSHYDKNCAVILGDTRKEPLLASSEELSCLFGPAGFHRAHVFADFSEFQKEVGRLPAGVHGAPAE